MTDTNTNTTPATLAARAAGLLSKTTAYAAAEKALDQALTAKRVYPPLAQDFGQQLGHDLPLKTRDFVAVVGRLLASSEKPVKGVISKRKSEILSVLSELVGALTDTAPIALPSWAVPKERAPKKEAEADVTGALDRANAEALAVQAAEAAEAVKVEAKSDTALAKAVALIVASAAELSEEQRELIRAALASTEAALL